MQITFSDNRELRGAFLVYFNGIEIPAISVDVSFGVWTIPSATVTVAADHELYRLGREDRIQVAIFYLDNHYAEEGNEPAPTFRLMFEGEVTGYQYTNAESQRSMAFTVHNHNAIFTQLFPFFMTGLDNMVQASLMPDAGSSSFAEYGPTFPMSIFYRGLNHDSNKLVKRPYDLVENVFRGLTDHDIAQRLNSSVAHNFFGKWARTTNFMNKWVSMPFLENEDLDFAPAEGIFPMVQATRSNETINALIAQSQKLANNSDFWTYFRDIFNRVYYEIGTVPAPPAVTVDIENADILGPPEFGTVRSDGRGRGPAVYKKPIRIATNITKPQLKFATPPACNVIFPSMYRTVQFQENFVTQPTRIYMAEKTVLDNLSRGEENGVTAAAIRANTVGYPPEADKVLQLNSQNSKTSNYDFLVWPEEFFKGPVMQMRVTPPWLSMIHQQYAAAQREAAGDPGKDDVLTYRESLVLNFYASGEYYREKFSNRYSSIDMSFNPYLVPGFPGFIFDRESTGMHTYMYVNDVRHRLAQNTMSTVIGCSFMQLMDEFFENYAESVVSRDLDDHYDSEVVKELTSRLLTLSDEYQDVPASLRKPETLELMDDLQKQLTYFTTHNAPIDHAPVAELPSIRRRFQNIDHAEQLYAKLFHRKPIDIGSSLEKNKEAAFDWRAAIGVKTPVQPGVEDVKFYRVKQGDHVNVRSNALTDGNYVPQFAAKGKFSGMSKNYTEAMRYVARPACTLEEYIDFHGSRGVRRGPVEAFDRDLGKGAKFYIQILDFVEGPGPEPTRQADGHRTSPVLTETRFKWSTRLFAYRDKVLNSTQPFTE